LYSKLKIAADKLNIKNILNGTNFDDIQDYRPGMAAAEEYGVISPLKDAKFTKDDVRMLARHLRLEIWDKPASPCLASRVPYGMEVTLRKLSMIEKAENFLKDNFGIRELRVRHFGSTARIEVNENSKPVIECNFDLILKKYELFEKWEGIKVTIPRTVVLSSDVFDEFMEAHNLYSIALKSEDDQEILDAFVAAKLPSTVLQDLYAFISVIKGPIAVRSSSKLEDSHYQPFAGIYSTYMVPKIGSMRTAV